MDAYFGEIRLFAGNFAPRGWAFCNGQLLNINEYQVLYTILGTQFGGDGKTTFALPNLCGKAAIHQGAGEGLTSRNFASTGGSKTVTLSENEIPAHTHIPQYRSDTLADQVNPVNNIWANIDNKPFLPNIYINIESPEAPMDPKAISSVGGGEPHNNMQPFLGLNFIIALDGDYYPIKS